MRPAPRGAGYRAIRYTPLGARRATAGCRSYRWPKFIIMITESILLNVDVRPLRGLHVNSKIAQSTNMTPLGSNYLRGLSSQLIQIALI